MEEGPDARDDEGPDPIAGGPPTLVDAATFVLGAAVASVHIRSVLPAGLPGAGWALIWATFAGIALTAAGPFLLLARRIDRSRSARPKPKAGDWLWALLGLPWAVAALVRTATAPARARPDDPTAVALAVGLGLATMIALAVVWKTWVMVPRGRLAAEGPTSWTERIGLVLAIAWPVQCGLGLVVIDGSS